MVSKSTDCEHSNGCTWTLNKPQILFYYRKTYEGSGICIWPKFVYTSKSVIASVPRIKDFKKIWMPLQKKTVKK